MVKHRHMHMVLERFLQYKVHCSRNPVAHAVAHSCICQFRLTLAEGKNERKVPVKSLLRISLNSPRMNVEIKQIRIH